MIGEGYAFFYWHRHRWPDCQFYRDPFTMIMVPHLWESGER